MSTKGIDVSKWQGQIDWAKVKAAGVDFAMIRLGYGSSAGDNCKMDEYFYANMNGALAAGVDVGVYFYSYAKTPAAASKEAEFVIEKLAPFKTSLRYPVAFDIEDPGQKDLGKTILTAMVGAFCQAIENAGYWASFYTSLDWCQNRLDMTALKRYDLWLAQWAAKASTAYAHGMWQYISTGTVAGVSGNMDMNIAYKDYPTLISAMLQPAPVEEVTVDEALAQARQVVETLEKIRGGM